MKTLNIFLSQNLLNTKDTLISFFYVVLHCMLFHSLLRGDFPSRWLQLLQCPLVSLLDVPDRVEESLLQN